MVSNQRPMSARVAGASFAPGTVELSKVTGVCNRGASGLPSSSQKSASGCASRSATSDRRIAAMSNARTHVPARASLQKDRCQLEGGRGADFELDFRAGPKRLRKSSADGPIPNRCRRPRRRRVPRLRCAPRLFGAAISADTTGYTPEIVAPNGCVTVTVVERNRKNSRGSCSMSSATS